MPQAPAIVPGRAPTLVDSRGQPLRKDLLTQEIAAASLMTARSILGGHPADGMTPARLGAVLREAETGNATAYLELAEQIEEKDLHYLAVLGTRKRQVSQLQISVEDASGSVADKRAGDLVRDWLKRDTIESDIFDILDAIGKGFSESEMIWDTSGREWTIDRIELRDPRWFQFDYVDGRTPLLRGEAEPTPLPPYKFIDHLHPAKSGLPIRGGLARPAAWGWLFKNYALKDWVAFAEIFGMPFRLGRYQPGATADDIRTLARAVAGISQDAAAVVPQSMEIEFIDGKANGSADLYQKLCEYIDKQISKAVLGQTATTDSEGGGLGGSGKEHNDVRGDIERADAKLLAATLTRDVVGPLVMLNLGPDVGRPKIKIGREETIDYKKVGELGQFLAVAVPMGLDVSQQDVRDVVGLRAPDDGEPVLKAAPPPSPAPFGMPALPAPGTDGPAEAASAFLGLLNRLPGANGLATARATAGGGGPVAGTADLIDRFQARELGDWQALIAPEVAALDAVFAGAATLEEASARLAAAATTMDPKALTELLARAFFVSRLAGVAGVSVEPS